MEISFILTEQMSIQKGTQCALKRYYFHLFHWEHFLEEIIVLKNRHEARTCVTMSR